MVYINNLNTNNLLEKKFENKLKHPKLETRHVMNFKISQTLFVYISKIENSNIFEQNWVRFQIICVRFQIIWLREQRTFELWRDSNVASLHTEAGYLRLRKFKNSLWQFTNKRWTAWLGDCHFKILISVPSWPLFIQYTLRQRHWGWH